jgi:uncharacterized delta-60 repeat protein
MNPNTAAGIAAATVFASDVCQYIVPGDVTDYATTRGKPKRWVMRQLQRIATCIALASGCAPAWAGPVSDSGALDSTFGSGGKVQVSFGLATGVALTGSIVATDLAIQPDGKIVVAGYVDYILTGTTHYYGWIEGRFNDNGSVDTGFGGFGTGFTSQYVGGHLENQAASIGIRPNGKIVVGGTIRDDNNGLLTAVVIQLDADGTFDTSWGNNGAVYFTPAPGDATKTRAIVLDTIDPYAVGNVYAVGQYTHSGSPTCNNFFYAGISPDGKTKVSNTFQASEACNVSESATNLAVQPGTGNVIVGGYSAFATGSTRCSAISAVIFPSAIFPQAYLYTIWGNSGAISFTVSGAQFPNDFCNAVAMNADGSTAIGGYGNANANGSGTYQAAVLALYDNNGALEQYFSSGLLYPDQYAFDYSGNSLNVNNANAINKLLREPYDGLTIALGFNNDSHLFPARGDDFAVARLAKPIYTDFGNDSYFHGGNALLVDWGSYHSIAGSFISNDRIQSGAIDAHGRLVVAGYASDPAGGNDIAIARLAAFDGIFKSGFEAPSY